MNSKLALIHRRMQRQSPEQAPMPAEDDLTAAIQRLVDERVEQALEERPAKQPAHVQRLLDQQLDRQFYKPAPVTDYRPPKKPMPPFEMVVSQRDHRRRIAKMLCKQIDGEGPTIEICVMQRDELGGIVRLTAGQIEDTPLPDPNPIAGR